MHSTLKVHFHLRLIALKFTVVERHAHSPRVACYMQPKRRYVCLFVCIGAYIPVNNLSVMSGRSSLFLSLTSSVGSSMNVSCSRTQHGDACGDRTQDLSIRSPTLYHYATTLPFYYSEKASSFLKSGLL